MDLLFYCITKQIPNNREVHTVLPAMVFTREPLVYTSPSGTSHVFYSQSGFLDHPKFLLETFVAYYSLHVGEEVINQTIATVTSYIQIKNKKFKTNVDFKAIASGNKFLKTLRNEVMRYTYWNLMHHYQHKINPFWKAKQIVFSYASENENASANAVDEKVAKIFMASLTDPEYVFICTENILEAGGRASLNDAPSKKIFFNDGILTLEMFHLPGFLSFKQSKLVLLREELQPELSDWHKAFDQLAVDVSTISFSAGNGEQIKKEIHEKFLPAVLALQKKTEESIYIQQLVNDEYGEYGSTMELAVCSRLHLLNALEKTEQISEGTAAELREQFLRDDIADKTICFILHTVPKYPEPDKNIKHEEINELWEKSFL